jgi:hypothetical protein
MFHTADSRMFERPINTLAVGCGGNGSAIAVDPYIYVMGPS